MWLFELLKAKICYTTTMNALTSKKKKKYPNQLNIKKEIILFLSLWVNDCILMYLKTTILYIYNFLILYKCLFEVFFFSLYSGLPLT